MSTLNEDKKSKSQITEEKSIKPQISEEHHLVVLELASHIAPKYVFAHFTRDDLIQEAYIMGLDALTRYDNKRPIRNFLANHMSNRLKTFKRDHYFRPNAGTAEALQVVKRALMCPGNIDKVANTYEVDYSELVGVAEEKEILDRSIPASYRKDYLRMLHGVRITPTRKKEIVAIIKHIEKGGLRG